jgi:hypothetical protein
MRFTRIRAIGPCNIEVTHDENEGSDLIDGFTRSSRIVTVAP